MGPKENPNWNHNKYAFPQPSFPPQVPVKHHTPGCSSFTLNTWTHVWKHPYQRRWRPGAPTAGWRAAWGVDFPAQMCLVSASSWEFSVFECLAAHIHTTQYLCDSLQQEVGFFMFIDHVVCAHMGKKSGSPQTLFCLLVFSW